VTYGSNIPPDGIVTLTWTRRQLNDLIRRHSPLGMKRRTLKKRVSRLVEEWSRCMRRQRDRHDRRTTQAIPSKEGK
jgi:hypothetical protein